MAQLATIATNESGNIAKASVFNAWSDLLSLTSNWSVDALMEETDLVSSTKPSGLLYGYHLSPTSLTFDTFRLMDTAADWQRILTGIPLSNVTLASATSPVPPRFPIFKITDDTEVIDFCARHNAFFDGMKYYSAILVKFDNIQTISMEVARDPEIEGFETLRFRVKLADEIPKIVEEEDNFEEFVQRTFSAEVLSHFTVTLEIADAGPRLSISSI